MPTMPESIANDNHDAEAALATAFSRVLAARVGTDGSFAERESEALRLGNEIIRGDLERALEGLVVEHGEDDLLIGGVRHRRHADGSARYHSLAGPLDVSRPTYRKVGEHNGPIVVPLVSRPAWSKVRRQPWRSESPTDMASVVPAHSSAS